LSPLPQGSTGLKIFKMVKYFHEIFHEIFQQPRNVKYFNLSHLKRIRKHACIIRVGFTFVSWRVHAVKLCSCCSSLLPDTVIQDVKKKIHKVLHNVQIVRVRTSKQFPIRYEKTEALRW
jgi:hypothetical protein